MQFSGLGSSKMEISETDFFDILTIHNDQISYVKHGLALLYARPSTSVHIPVDAKRQMPSLCVFHSIWVLGEGVPGGLGHNRLMQFSSLGDSKVEISETDFFATLTIQKDGLSHVKHDLAPLHVFFT